ncbi:MAG: hypothetical protein J6V33_01505 [Bacteroidales bacterium]|nr:hypothetical protein [Bacteroidales bacterium]
MIKRKIKTTKRNIATLLFIGFICIFGCTSKEETYLYGSWIWEGSGNKAEEITGFTLGKGGLASTINIRKNHYETWLLDDNALIIEGKKIEDTCFTFLSDTFYIKSLTKDRLVVIYNDKKYHYKKEQ